MFIFIKIFIQMEIVNYIFQSISKKKEKPWISHGICIMFSFFLTIFNFSSFFIASLISAFCFSHLYDKKILEGIILLLLNQMNYYSVQYILDLLYLFTGKSVFVTNSKELITLLLVFFLSNLIVHILLQRTKSSEIEYSNLIFAIPSVIALLMKIVLENEALHSIYFFSTVLMIVLPTTGYVTIYYYYKSFENIELENQLRLNQKQLLVSKKQADYLNRLYRENFEDFHKVLHQLKDIGSMIDDVDTEIKEKLETLMSDIDRSYNAYLANSYAMNMAIQYYDKEIKENNISIRNTIFETLYFLPLQEEIEVFKKILEIGIHYCLKVKEEERLIIIQTREYDNRFVLRFSFPYVQEYDEVSNIFTHYFTYQMRIFREIDRELEIETYSLMFPITVE